MKLLEWSDAQLKFEITQDGQAINFNEYSKFLLEIRFIDSIVEIEGEIQDWNLVFEIFGERTTGRVWKVDCDIRWIKGEKKVRFNQNTIEGVILSSIKVPWLTQN